MTIRTFSTVDRNWLLLQGLGLLIAAIMLLAVFEGTALDLAVSHLLFDHDGMRFPMQHHWFFSEFLHHGLKSASFALGFAALAVALFGMRGKLDWLPPRQAALAALGTMLIPLLTSGLKLVSNRHCPWDVTDFGGYAPYVSLFASTSPDLVRGVCFPAGHASAGFAWLAWALALRQERPVAARIVFAIALGIGLAMGAGRMAQGAHFVSHVLWSAWFAWALSLALAAFLRAPVVPPVNAAALAGERLQGA
jgi:membrane-associated PAP2 superfamily phosphatase